jgi:hypothetical protein
MSWYNTTNNFRNVSVQRLNWKLFVVQLLVVYAPYRFLNSSTDV